MPHLVNGLQAGSRVPCVLGEVRRADQRLRFLDRTHASSQWNRKSLRLVSVMPRRVTAVPDTFGERACPPRSRRRCPTRRYDPGERRDCGSAGSSASESGGGPTTHNPVRHSAAALRPYASATTCSNTCDHQEMLPLTQRQASRDDDAGDRRAGDNHLVVDGASTACRPAACSSRTPHAKHRTRSPSTQQRRSRMSVVRGEGMVHTVRTRGYPTKS